MDVSEAVQIRKSTRDFLPDPVDSGLIRDLLDRARRAPSGGNLQPWRIWVLNGDSMAAFRTHMAEAPSSQSMEYDIYPPKLWDPYRTNRYQVGEQMYATIGVGRDDKPGRQKQFARNMDFFGAPAALFCFVDRNLGPPQWSDLGMFLQTFMLLAEEAGYQTCPQEAWAAAHEQVRSFTNAPEELMLFCGMAIGKANTEHPINSLVSERQPVEEFATFV
ncbi:MAG: nitroreductase [Actinomycetota bacterium]